MQMREYILRKVINLNACFSRRRCQVDQVPSGPGASGLHARFCRFPPAVCDLCLGSGSAAARLAERLARQVRCRALVCSVGRLWQGCCRSKGGALCGGRGDQRPAAGGESSGAQLAPAALAAVRKNPLFRFASMGIDKDASAAAPKPEPELRTTLGRLAERGPKPVPSAKAPSKKRLRSALLAYATM